MLVGHWYLKTSAGTNETFNWVWNKMLWTLVNSCVEMKRFKWNVEAPKHIKVNFTNVFKLFTLFRLSIYKCIQIVSQHDIFARMNKQLMENTCCGVYERLFFNTCSYLSIMRLCVLRCPLSAFNVLLPSSVWSADFTLVWILVVVYIPCITWFRWWTNCAF